MTGSMIVHIDWEMAMKKMMDHGFFLVILPVIEVSLQPKTKNKKNKIKKDECDNNLLEFS
jgi:hypothetical protein